MQADNGQSRGLIQDLLGTNAQALPYAATDHLGPGFSFTGLHEDPSQSFLKEVTQSLCLLASPIASSGGHLPCGP